MTLEQLGEHYEANRGAILKKLIWRAGTPQDAEDILHNAYYRAIRYADSYVGTQPFDNWFNRIVNNCLRDFKNAQKAGENVVSFDEEEDVDIGVTIQYTHELVEEIKARIKDQKEPVREILTLHFLNEYQPKDISHIVDISYSNVRKIVERFRGELKERYK